MKMFALVVVTVAALVGCRVKPSSDLVGPAVSDRVLFKVVSDYYCTYRGWPTRWEEVVAFLESQAPLPGSVPAAGDPTMEQVSADLGRLQEFSSPTLAVSRAIVLSVTYSPLGSSDPGSSGAASVRRRVSFIAPPSCGDAGNPELVSIAGGRVLFRLPDSFSLLSTESIKERWKNPPFPDVAWSDSSSDAAVAVRFGEAELKSDTAKKFKSGLESAYEASVPGLRWITRKLDKAGNRPVLLHEFESDASRGRLITAVISVPFDDKLLSLNVVGPALQREWINAVALQLQQTLSFPSE